MSRNFLSKVTAGAGLGAASLLICAPAAAVADTPTHDPRKGHIHTEPKGVKPGHKFKVILECDHPEDRPWASSKVTGKLWLTPSDDKREGSEYGSSESGGSGYSGSENDSPGYSDSESGGSGYSGSERDSRSSSGTGGKDRYSKDDEAKDDHAKDDKTWDDKTKDEHSAGGYDSEDPGGADARHGAKYWAWAKVPWKTKAGNYEFEGSCDGHGTVSVLPTGSVGGGDGGATTGTDRTAAGAGMLSAAAIGGFMLLRRRRGDGALA